MNRERKVLGLNLELATLVSALHGMRVLMEGEDGGSQREPLAILGVVIARLDVLRAAIRGEVDPAIIWAEHSSTVAETDARPTDDEELRLAEWTPDVAVKRLNAQLRRLGPHRKRSG